MHRHVQALLVLMLVGAFLGWTLLLLYYQHVCAAPALLPPPLATRNFTHTEQLILAAEEAYYGAWADEFHMRKLSHSNDPRLGDQEPRRKIATDDGGDEIIIYEQPSDAEIAWPAEAERCETVGYLVHEPAVDSRGYVCPQQLIDRSSGCCLSRRRAVCLSCSLGAKCCQLFTSCVSCCMASGDAESPSSFAICTHACRTSSRSMAQLESSSSGTRRSDRFVHCYAGPRSAPAYDSDSTPPSPYFVPRNASSEADGGDEFLTF